MLQYKAENDAEDFLPEHVDEASSLGDKLENYILANKKGKEKEEKTVKEEKGGIVSALLRKEHKGKNKYFVTIVIEEDAPMISPVFILVLKNIESIGTLLYSSITDEDLWGTENNENRVLEMILCTDIYEAELYSYFSIFYLEKINIINLNRDINEINDYYLNETDYTPYLIIYKSIIELYRIAFTPLSETGRDTAGDTIKQLQDETTDALGRIKNRIKSQVYGTEFSELFRLTKKMLNSKGGKKQKVKADIQERVISFIEKMTGETKGRYIVKYIKLNQNNPINSLKNYIDITNKASTLIFLIDLSMLSILHEMEIKDLVKIKKDLQEQGIEVGLIAGKTGSRRIINIFDSIKQVFEINLFSSETEAVLNMIQSSESSQRIIGRIKQLINE